MAGRAALACATSGPSLVKASVWGSVKHLCTISDRQVYLQPLSDSEGISEIVLDRPKARNAIGKQLLEELFDAILELKNQADMRCVLLSSKVPGVFSAGADLQERAKMSQAETLLFVTSLRATFSELESLPMPTIAVVDGHALGGGTELALACDLRVAGPEAKFALPETRLGIIPGAGGTQRLPRLVGLTKAKELIFTGRRIGFEEAHKIGLVDHAVHPGESAYERAADLARDIAKGGPVALRMAKAAIGGGLEMGLQAGLSLEQHCYAQVIPTQDRLEGLKAFAEKRPPKFTGT